MKFRNTKNRLYSDQNYNFNCNILNQPNTYRNMRLLDKHLLQLDIAHVLQYISMLYCFQGEERKSSYDDIVVQRWWLVHLLTGLVGEASFWLVLLEYSSPPPQLWCGWWWMHSDQCSTPNINPLYNHYTVD